MNSGGSLSSGIASFSIGISLPHVLVFFVVVVALFAIVKLFR